MKRVIDFVIWGGGLTIVFRFFAFPMMTLLFGEEIARSSVFELAVTWPMSLQDAYFPIPRPFEPCENCDQNPPLAAVEVGALALTILWSVLVFSFSAYFYSGLRERNKHS